MIIHRQKFFILILAVVALMVLVSILSWSNNNHLLSMFTISTVTTVTKLKAVAVATTVATTVVTTTTSNPSSTNVIITSNNTSHPVTSITTNNTNTPTTSPSTTPSTKPTLTSTTTPTVNSNSQKQQQDTKCQNMFEWSMIYKWKEINNKPDNIIFDTTTTTYHDNHTNNNVTSSSSSSSSSLVSQTRNLSISRMGGPSATGTISMSITIRPPNHKNNNGDNNNNNSNNKSDLTIVDVRGKGFQFRNKDGNLWHRMTKQYYAWVGLQVAQKRYNLISSNVIYLWKCPNEEVNNNKKEVSSDELLSYLPSEWVKIGNVSCDTSLLDIADVIVVPPTNGLLWDLAWDLDFTCYNSDMFHSFTSLFVNKKELLPNHESMMGCFISRQGRPIRAVVNYNETLQMMNDVFSNNVRVIALSTSDTNDDTINLLYDCKVLFGVHGAGHMNAMFARPGVAVVEMIGKSNPAYFRNINMLLGQKYEAIYGDREKGMGDQFIVDLVEARDALERAKDYITKWLKDHNDYWR